MARIRSIHPGFFRDEDLLSVSMAARLLFLGLGTEADDKGVFEWKLITLKINIFPLDSIDIAALLGELQEANAIRQFDIGGKKYGAIRNFRRHQRPKKPNDIHPISDEIRTYVGSSGDNAPPVPHQFPTNGEKSPQMEDGGGRGSGKGSRVSNETLSPSAGEGEKAITFEDFRRPYPKFDGLNAARKDWDAAIAKGVKPQDILDGLERWNAEWERRIGDPNRDFGPQHIPNAGKWLAGEGWLDPVPDAPPQLVDKPWTGPEPLRKAIVAAIGPDAAKSCFAASDWDGDQIIPRTTWVLEKLAGVPECREILAPVRRAA